MSLLRARRMRLRDFSCIRWLPPAFERRTRPEPDTRKRFFTLLLVFIFGMGPGFMPGAPLKVKIRRAEMV
jgi:hypothetical protein